MKVLFMAESKLTDGVKFACALPLKISNQILPMLTFNLMHTREAKCDFVVKLSVKTRSKNL